MNSNKAVADVPRLLFADNSARTFLSHRLSLARAARGAGFEVLVTTPNEPAATEILSAEFNFHPIPLTRQGTNPFGELKAVVSFCHLYRRLRPDLVHHFRIKPVLYGGIAARLAGIPAVVNTVTGLGFTFLADGTRASARRFLVKQGLRHAFRHSNQRIIFQNPEDQGEFLEAGIISEHDAILIKGAGVDVEVFKPVVESEGPPLVMLPSRMLWHKGVGEFVAAARALRANGVNARFALVGDTDPGNPAAVPRAQLETWGDSGIVEWWGWREDMSTVLARAHVVCLPSYREGMPKVLIEAAAAGRPIVTTQTPGCREAVRDGQNGLLVPVRDIESLVTALRALIENPGLRARLGACGREIAVREFSEAVVISQTLNIYRDLIGDTGPTTLASAYSRTE
jgi:glycosyltransferase involved in cell wall biosynthesis